MKRDRKKPRAVVSVDTKNRQEKDLEAKFSLLGKKLETGTPKLDKTRENGGNAQSEYSAENTVPGERFQSHQNLECFWQKWSCYGMKGLHLTCERPG